MFYVQASLMKYTGVTLLYKKHNRRESLDEVIYAEPTWNSMIVV